MSPKKKAAEAPVAPADCTDCDKVRIEKELDAAESARVFARDLQKLDRQREIDLAKLDKEHANALDSAEDTAVTELQKSRWQAEFDLSKLFHEKLTELAGGSIERTRDSAKYIQTAATAIATVYTGLLALVFSVTDNPLPLRGVFAAGFLGLAIALAAAYLAFITRPDRVQFGGGGSSLNEQQLSRTGFLIRWINTSVRDRRWALRASVISLAVGVAFIPAAFVASSRPAKIPDAPAAPSIPPTIAAQIAEPAAELFSDQLSGYRAAALARNEAIEKAADDSAQASSRESDLNLLMIGLAGVGLLVVLLGPWIYGRARDA